MEFFGHIMRNKEMENIIVTGKIEGVRSRGRPRITYTQSLSMWMGMSEAEMIWATKDRQRWKTITSNVWIRQGT